MFLRPAFVLLFCFALPVLSPAEDVKPIAANPALAAANRLWQSGRFAEAETSYRALIQSDPNLLPAYAGLVRSLLREDMVDEAGNAITAAVKSLGELPDLLAARGDVQYRLGQISQAESSYTDAKALDRKLASAYLGLASVYRCQSFYRRAYDEIQRAHEIAPNDIDVQRAWISTLPRPQQLAALQAYLNGPHPDDVAENRWLTDAVDFLKQSLDQPAHSCRLVSKVDRTQTQLYTVRSPGSARSGIGVATHINDLSVNLKFDTGSGGISVNRKVGEKAKLTRISAAHLAGLGDKGSQTGYLAVADRVQIGELAFQDCVVFVSDSNSVGTEDGLIGADVFGSYLVDIDLPGSRLTLSPLPKRPDDTTAPTALHSERQSEFSQAAKGEAQAGLAADSTLATGSSQFEDPNRHYPKDRYIAPEMSRWTEIFRIGHDLLVPTKVNDSDSKLFLLDTGAFDNIVSVRASQQVAKVKSSFGMKVAGLSGDVKKVYHSKVTLRFGHLQQSNVDTVTLDLSKISHQSGIEISGLLGFTMLQMLEVKLDYRDGLVDLTFDPAKVQQLLKK